MVETEINSNSIYFGWSNENISLFFHFYFFVVFTISCRNTMFDLVFTVLFIESLSSVTIIHVWWSKKFENKIEKLPQIPADNKFASVAVHLLTMYMDRLFQNSNMCLAASKNEMLPCMWWCLLTIFPYFHNLDLIKNDTHHSIRANSLQIWKLYARVHSERVANFTKHLLKRGE